MIKIIKRLLGIDLLEHRLEVTLEELAQDDTKVVDRMRRVEKDMADLLVYLNVERKEEWKEDTSYSPPQPKLVKSKWIKKK